MSTAIVTVCFAMNAWLSAYWLCEIVETILAMPFAIACFQSGKVSGLIFVRLSGHLIWVLALAVVSSLLMLEVSLWGTLGQARYPMWPVHSAGLGLASVVIAVCISPRFREELSAGADRRVLRNWRGLTPKPRWISEMW